MHAQRAVQHRPAHADENYLMENQNDGGPRAKRGR